MQKKYTITCVGSCNLSHNAYGWITWTGKGTSNVYIYNDIPNNILLLVIRVYNI